MQSNLKETLFLSATQQAEFKNQGATDGHHLIYTWGIQISKEVTAYLLIITPWIDCLAKEMGKNLRMFLSKHHKSFMISRMHSPPKKIWENRPVSLSER